MKPWMIWDIERKREERERAEEAGRAIYAPPPPSPSEIDRHKREEEHGY